MLVQMELIRQDQLDEALERGEETGKKLGQNLVELGYINDAHILQLLAAQEAATPWMLDSDPPDHATLKILPKSVCKEHSVIPVCRRGDLLLLAMADPKDIQAVQRVRAITGLRIEPVMADADKIKSIIQHLPDPASTPVEDEGRPEVAKLISAARSAVDADGDGEESVECLTEDETAPVVGLVDQIIGDAIRAKATDIHIEPTEDDVAMRFRVDGCLRQVGSIPKSLQLLCVNRLKLMAGLDVMVNDRPQTGRISIGLESRTVELRVNVMLNAHGERVALRLLDESVRLNGLSNLGFDERIVATLQSIIKRPSGLFLATGPAGSGITTTLYSLLGELHDDSLNIMTCERVIECNLANVNQSQFGDDPGSSCARQLDAVLRQDPDVILLSGILDEETAEIAVTAALNGHLIISSLQCANAAGAIARMLAFGIDPFLLSTTLIGSMAQRLVRTLCPSCKQHTADGWASGGCEECGDIGLSGRTAVSEVIAVTADVSELIAQRASLREIQEAAAEHGFVSIHQDAFAKVGAGLTSREEAVRVLGDLQGAGATSAQSTGRQDAEESESDARESHTPLPAEIRLDRVREYHDSKDEPDLEAHFHLNAHELPSYPPDEDAA